MEKILIDDTYASRDARQYIEVAPTLRSERFGFKVIEYEDEDNTDTDNREQTR